jgi:hypothetical protein
MRVLCLATTLLAVAAARTAAADEQRGAIPRHRLGLDVGLASALGSVGADYQAAPLSWLRLEAGVGWGPTGMQLSLMPKLALGGRTFHFTSGVGASLAVGGGQARAGHGPASRIIPWLNFDGLGVEVRSRSGLSFQAAIGLTMPLADFHYDIADLGDTVHAGEVLPQGRIGVGWWL